MPMCPVLYYRTSEVSSQLHDKIQIWQSSSKIKSDTNEIRRFMINFTIYHRIQEGKNVKFKGSPGRFQQASA
jgi:hypothetical protein